MLSLQSMYIECMLVIYGGYTMKRALYLLPIPIYVIACIIFGALAVFYSSLTFAFGLILFSVIGYFLIDACVTKSGFLEKKSSPKPKEDELDEIAEAEPATDIQTDDLVSYTD